MHPGIWITKVETNNHGATLKNILPEKMERQWNVEGWRYFLMGEWLLDGTFVNSRGAFVFYVRLGLLISIVFI